MSRGINKVHLIGNLGHSPELRYMPDGRAVANISLATSDQWKDKNTGQQQERTEWHRVVLYARLAEIAGQYLHRGSKIYIEGSLRTRKYTAKDGSEKYTTEVIGRELQMLDSRTSTNEQPPQQAPERPASTPPMTDNGMPFSDDDIPF